MRTHQFLAMSLFCLLTFGCAHNKPGLILPPIPLPTPAELTSTLHVNEIMYIENDTYAADPSLLIGKILQINKSGSECTKESPEGRCFWLDRISGYPITPSTSPVLRGSHVVDRRLAASVSLLSYLSTSLDETSLYSIIVTDVDVRRADDADKAYGTAVATWVQGHEKLMNDPDVCWLILVDGVVHKTIVRHHFTKARLNAAAGAFGVNVAGNYYTSDQDYQLDHRFGLSVSILKQPSGSVQMFGGIEGIRRLRLTEDERNMLATMRTIPEEPVSK